MAAETITFPSFADLGRQAREIERGMLQVKPSQISGTLQSPEDASLFPREFEDYTAAYLVSEAHKVERKIFATTYQAEIVSMPAAQAPEGVGGQKRAAEELRQFASAQPQAQGGERPAGEPAQVQPREIPKTGGFKLPIFGKGASAPPPPPVSRPAQPEQAPRVPPQIPVVAQEQEQPVPEEEKPAPESALDEAPAVRPLRPPSSYDDRMASPGESAAEGAGEAESSLEQKPPSSALTASSKISPRLRAIIEEKLRKEEQKGSEEQVEIGKEESPAEPEPEQAQDEMPVMSARERLLRRLQRQKGPAAEEGKAAEQPGREIAGEGEEVAIPQEEQQEQAGQEAAREEQPQEIPAAKKSRPSLSIKAAFGAEGEETQPEPSQQGQAGEGGAAPAQEEPRLRAPKRAVLAPPGKGRESEPQPETGRAAEEKPKAASKVRAGSITIAPIFSGEEAEGKEGGEAPAPEEGTERMERIRRIMNELSPDRVKAGVMPKRAGQGEERQEEPPAAEDGEVSAAPAAVGAKPAKVRTPAKKQARQKAKGVPAARAAAPAKKTAGPVPETFGRQPARAAAKKTRQIGPVADKAKTVQREEEEQEPQATAHAIQVSEKAVPVQAVRSVRKANAAKIAPAASKAKKGKAPPSRQLPSRPTAKAIPAPQLISQPAKAAPVPKPVLPPKKTAPAPQPVPRVPVSQPKVQPSVPAQRSVPSSGTGPAEVQAKVLPSVQARRAIPGAVRPSAAQAKVGPSVQPVAGAARIQPSVAAVSRTTAGRAPDAPPAKPYPQATGTAAARPRILPGGISGAPSPKTYVPPLRRKLVPQEQEEGQAEPVSQGAGDEEPEPGEEQQPVAVSSAKARLRAGQPSVSVLAKQEEKESEDAPQAESQGGKGQPGRQ